MDNQINIKNIAANENIIFMPAKYSYNELIDIMDRIHNVASNKLSISQYFDFWWIEERSNRVFVFLNKFDDGVIAEFKQTVSDSPAIEFKQSLGRIQTEASLSPGQLISGTMSTPSSVGYRVTRYGQHGVIMAGHATFKNEVFRVNGINVAKCEITQEQGNIDAAFCSTMDYGTSPDNYIYGTGNELSTTTQQPGPGTAINKCGFRTGITSGYVDNINAEAIATNGNVLRNLTTVSYNSDSGDSGGVVYTYRSSSNTRYTCGIHMERLGSYAIFVKADEINYALGTNRF